MKCPRCGHEIKKEEKYCSHCGLDLTGKYRPIKRKKTSSMLIYIILFISFMAIPFLYSKVLDNVFEDIEELDTTQVKLPEIKNMNATAIIGTYSSIEEFKNQFNNIDPIISSIKEYETTLPQGYTYEKDYQIQVLNNFDILYSINYKTQVSESLFLTIKKECNRSHTSNNETYVFEKKNQNSFEQLIFNDEEQDIVESIIKTPSSIKTVLNDFSQRKEEFNMKKKKLGHYGIGNYEDSSSFVVYRYKEAYTSRLTYKTDSKKYI